MEEGIFVGSEILGKRRGIIKSEASSSDYDSSRVLCSQCSIAGRFLYTRFAARSPRPINRTLNRYLRGVITSATFAPKARPQPGSFPVNLFYR